jgi:hypothetical protein
MSEKYLEERGCRDINCIEVGCLAVWNWSDNYHSSTQHPGQDPDTELEGDKHRLCRIIFVRLSMIRPG